MTTLPIRILLAITVVLAAGCPDDGSTGAQTTGVVQETNMPCDQTTCACDREFFYMEQVIRDCSSMQARISICSDQPVCTAVLDALAAQVTTCAEPASPFAIDLAPCD